MKKVEIKIFFIAVVLLIISILLPKSSLEFILGNGLRPVGLTSIFICPICGIIGLIFSIKNKNVIFGILNTMLVFTFPILMFVGYNLI